MTRTLQRMEENTQQRSKSALLHKVEMQKVTLTEQRTNKVTKQRTGGKKVCNKTTPTTTNNRELQTLGQNRKVTTTHNKEEETVLQNSNKEPPTTEDRTKG